MSKVDYTKKHLFRMVHIDNLSSILENGIFCKGIDQVDSNYINIGDISIISRRNNYTIGIDPPGGFLSEYFPFYFAGHSPMLLNIITGFRNDIIKRNQEDIVFIVCKIEDVVRDCDEWCFTDGHAMKSFSMYYNSIGDLDKLDWNTIGLQYWNNTEEDNDKMRRKEAEFLVRNFVPATSICAIIVKNQKVKLSVEKILNSKEITLIIHVDNNNRYFYP